MSVGGEDLLTTLNDQLTGQREARGVGGGLGRVKGPKGPSAFAAFEAAKRPKLVPAGEGPLYSRFTRGTVLGAEDEASAWRAHVDAALRDNGGEMTWPVLRDEVVDRWRKSHEGQDPAQWSHLALAHVPEAYLSRLDSVVRLVPGAS